MPDPSDSILNSAGMINAVICSGIIVAGTVFVKKIMRKELFAFKPLDIEINVDKSWIIILAFTIAHFFTSLYLIQACDKVLKAENITSEGRNDIWNSLTETNVSRLIFSNMQSRKNITKQESFFSRKIKFYAIQKNDLAGILSFAFVILVFLSLTRLKYKTKGQLIFHTSIALFLCLANWFIGSWWALKCSQLAM